MEWLFLFLTKGNLKLFKSSMMNLEDIKIYRMTHKKNIPHILQFGITHKTSSNANSEFITIGDLSLINTRESKKIIVDNGQIPTPAASEITLGDYIPFYFGIKMPMLYVMQNGGNFVAKATPAQDIIYLVCSLKKVIEAGGEYYFSDGHATDRLTSFYDHTRLQQLPEIIDWGSIKSSYWGGQDNLNIKRKKQAEFLVAKDIPPDMIFGFGCFNESAKQNLTNMGVDESQIKIIPNAYF